MIARSIAHALAVVLIDRVDRVAARASAPTWSTPGRPCRNRRSEASEAVMSATSGPVEAARDRRRSGRCHRRSLAPSRSAPVRRGVPSGRRPRRRRPVRRGGAVRVLVSSTPGYGHVLPMVPLARALLAAGHEVLWATAADACPGWRRPASRRRRPACTEAQLGDARRAIAAAAAGLRPEQLAALVFPRLFGAGPDAADAGRPAAGRSASGGPTCVVHENGELAAPLVAELLGVPHVTHAFGGAVPADILADAGAACRAAVGRARRRRCRRTPGASSTCTSTSARRPCRRCRSTTSPHRSRCGRSPTPGRRPSRCRPG